jgi:uncharacterized RDD family membrane protein YckC
MVDIKYQTGLRRLIAAIIDGLIFLPIGFIDSGISFSSESIVAHNIWLISISFLPILYSIFFHYYYGRTVGKALTGIKVLDISESRRMTFSQSCKRDIFLVLAQSFSVIYFLSTAGKFENTLFDSASLPDNFVILWTVIELITMLSNTKRRALHDFIAKSVVIRS